MLSCEIKGMKLPNRFVRSATWEGMATAEGACTPALIESMARLAEGKVGLIISGRADVSPEGQAGPRRLGIYRNELIAGLRQMTETGHAHHSGEGSQELSPPVCRKGKVTCPSKVS